MSRDGRTAERARVLADECNRAIVSLLAETPGPLQVEALATRLVDREFAGSSAPTDDAEFDRVLVDLHHARLPRLADLDLVDYDPDSGLVDRPAGATERVEWTLGGLTDAVVEHLGPGEDSEDRTAMLEGRDAVVTAGRRLVDSATSEVFCIYVSAALLEEGCITCCEQAIDRGVGFTLGSPDGEVRELARDRLPAATIWEPQRDWWGKQAPRRVGRLVLVDRQRVMLGILDRTDAAEDPLETAIVGHGRSHPIVVLVRDLLGPRLDHLDYQSEGFSGELPT